LRESKFVAEYFRLGKKRRQIHFHYSGFRVKPGMTTMRYVIIQMYFLVP